MKNLSLILGFFFLLSLDVVSQVNVDNVAKAGKVSDKNQVGFCNYNTDTLTFVQFRKCNEINVFNDPGMEVVSYTIVYRFGKDNIYEYKGTGRILPPNVTERILTDEITFFWVENIMVKKDGELLDIGTRKFYLKW